MKGVGRGVAGIGAKWFAAMSGTVGYPLKGLEVDVQKLGRWRRGDVVREARLLQGEQEYLECVDKVEKREIVERWMALTGIEGRVVGGG